MSYCPAWRPSGRLYRRDDLRRRRFRIPPREIPDILPQHLLMLKTAADAMQAAGLPLREDRPSMGAVIGIDFDFGATDFHLRWHLERVFPEWVRSRFPHRDPAAVDQWFSVEGRLRPPLTANRVLGALGSMVASRIAREFHLGGPSFVVSADAPRACAALEIGVRALESGELDTVLVGAVDLHGDLRNAALQQDDAGAACPADGAVALVLKRLDQARSDGHRIYGVVRGFGAAAGGASRTRRRVGERPLSTGGLRKPESRLIGRLGHGTHGRAGRIQPMAPRRRTAEPCRRLRCSAGRSRRPSWRPRSVSRTLRPQVRFALARPPRPRRQWLHVVLECGRRAGMLRTSGP